MTWEPESSLANSLIDDFEKGVLYEESSETEVSFGVTSHTLTVSKVNKVGPPPKKKFHTEVQHG